MRARQLVMEAMDGGWTGPPFDPIELAIRLGYEVTANSEVRDARIVAIPRGRARIEFNPNRPRGRMRYSIAHEIAHTLFPDFADEVRNRAIHNQATGDDWQLEALCNIAAAEFLMPLGSITRGERNYSLQAVLDLQRRFDVSTEALVIRLAETAEEPLAAFCASPRTVKGAIDYQLDYTIPSVAWELRFPRRLPLPVDSVVRHCSAIGYSAQGVEEWLSRGPPVEVQALGIPPYPGAIAPRVVGLLKPKERGDYRIPPISYVYGSAIQPRGTGARLVVQVVNDATPNWGGAGFASAVRNAWPHVQQDFQNWVREDPKALRLGQVRITAAEDRVTVASIVAQHGYGDSSRPRIRYSGLRAGLGEVAQFARKLGASVHMPRIGTGHARGSWAIVEDIVIETMRGVLVTVYDLPGSNTSPEAQMSLDLLAAEA
jgi:O-acetyl-ADP-ribose deacetylase (regulator of RNase III)